MPLRVRISEPALLSGLVDSLLRAKCVAQPVASDACVVVHAAGDGGEAAREVAFFVRAWRLGHPGVEVELSQAC